MGSRRKSHVKGEKKSVAVVIVVVVVIGAVVFVVVVVVVLHHLLPRKESVHHVQSNNITHKTRHKLESETTQNEEKTKSHFQDSSKFCFVLFCLYTKMSDFCISTARSRCNEHVSTIYWTHPLSKNAFDNTIVIEKPVKTWLSLVFRRHINKDTPPPPPAPKNCPISLADWIIREKHDWLVENRDVMMDVHEFIWELCGSELFDDEETDHMADYKRVFAKQVKRERPEWPLIPRVCAAKQLELIRFYDRVSDFTFGDTKPSTWKPLIWTTVPEEMMNTMTEFANEITNVWEKRSKKVLFAKTVLELIQVLNEDSIIPCPLHVKKALERSTELVVTEESNKKWFSNQKDLIQKEIEKTYKTVVCPLLVPLNRFPKDRFWFKDWKEWCEACDRMERKRKEVDKVNEEERLRLEGLRLALAKRQRERARYVGFLRPMLDRYFTQQTRIWQQEEEAKEMKPLTFADPLVVSSPKKKKEKLVPEAEEGMTGMMKMYIVPPTEKDIEEDTLTKNNLDEAIVALRSKLIRMQTSLLQDAANETFDEEKKTLYKELSKTMGMLNVTFAQFETEDEEDESETEFQLTRIHAMNDVLKAMEHVDKMENDALRRVLDLSLDLTKTKSAKTESAKKKMDLDLQVALQNEEKEAMIAKYKTTIFQKDRSAYLVDKSEKDAERAAQEAIRSRLSTTKANKEIEEMGLTEEYRSTMEKQKAKLAEERTKVMANKSMREEEALKQLREKAVRDQMDAAAADARLNTSHLSGLSLQGARELTELEKQNKLKRETQKTADTTVSTIRMKVDVLTNKFSNMELKIERFQLENEDNVLAANLEARLIKSVDAFATSSELTVFYPQETKDTLEKSRKKWITAKDKTMKEWKAIFATLPKPFQGHNRRANVTRVQEHSFYDQGFIKGKSAFDAFDDVRNKTTEEDNTLIQLVNVELNFALVPSKVSEEINSQVRQCVQKNTLITGVLNELTKALADLESLYNEFHAVFIPTDDSHQTLNKDIDDLGMSLNQHQTHLKDLKLEWARFVFFPTLAMAYFIQHCPVLQGYNDEARALQNTLFNSPIADTSGKNFRGTTEYDAILALLRGIADRSDMKKTIKTYWSPDGVIESEERLTNDTFDKSMVFLTRIYVKLWHLYFSKRQEYERVHVLYDETKVRITNELGVVSQRKTWVPQLELLCKYADGLLIRYVDFENRLISLRESFTFGKKVVRDVFRALTTSSADPHYASAEELTVQTVYEALEIMILCIRDYWYLSECTRVWQDQVYKVLEGSGLPELAGDFYLQGLVNLKTEMSRLATTNYLDLFNKFNRENAKISHAFSNSSVSNATADAQVLPTDEFKQAMVLVQSLATDMLVNELAIPESNPHTTRIQFVEEKVMKTLSKVFYKLLTVANYPSVPVYTEEWIYEQGFLRLQKITGTNNSTAIQPLQIVETPLVQVTFPDRFAHYAADAEMYDFSQGTISTVSPLIVRVAELDLDGDITMRNT
jgi:hypothetical protein